MRNMTTTFNSHDLQLPRQSEHFLQREFTTANVQTQRYLSRDQLYNVIKAGP